MDKSLAAKLKQALKKIDRPGSFCVHGSVPAILPGLEVKKMGAIGLPLVARQAQELRDHAEQAPYGKGTETLVDTSVRSVWRLTPDRFSLVNPDWDRLLKDVVGQVQKGLGLEKQKLEAHLYDLLLYEPGGFFLPHRDGEKLDRMVGTLVIVLPSPHEGGELVIRHEGREEIIDFGGSAGNAFQIQYAAFYADCEHEVRPLRQGYRLCLVYNLTLAKGKKGIQAPRASEHVEEVAGLLTEWAQDPAARKLVITLGHQYTEKGLAWDALKGVDRMMAGVIDEAARRAECKAYLALLTLWESGSAEGEYEEDYYGRRRGWRDEEEEEEEDEEESDEEDNAAEHEMGEVFDSSLSAKNGQDRHGNKLPMDELNVDEEDLLDPEALRGVKPEEDFEGYTGNAGMTLDRWYRHGAIILWPESRYFDVLCAESAEGTIPLLKQMVEQWREASKKDAPALKAQCGALAAAILTAWPDNNYGRAGGQKSNSDAFFGLLAALDERELINRYMTELMPKDVALDPGKPLIALCREHGWDLFESQLLAIFRNMTASAVPRNIRVLEQIASARPDKGDVWRRLCAELAREVVAALERIDLDKTTTDWRMRELDRKAVLPGLIRGLVSSNQTDLLSGVVAHMMAHPEQYPLIDVQLAALTSLQGWLKENVKSPNIGLSEWLAVCRAQLEALTADMPRKPADFRRPAPVKCTCARCKELNRFLADPNEETHRFMAPQHDRSHLEESIRRHECDVNAKTERTRPSHTLVCTKNINSYERAFKKYNEDVIRLREIKAIETGLPK